MQTTVREVQNTEIMYEINVINVVHCNNGQNRCHKYANDSVNYVRDLRINDTKLIKKKITVSKQLIHTLSIAKNELQVVFSTKFSRNQIFQLSDRQILPIYMVYLKIIFP